MINRSLKVWSLALILILVSLAACQPNQAQIPVTGESNTVTLRALDFSFEIPDQIPAGYVTFVMENAGVEVHHVQFVRLNDDVTLEEFNATLNEGPEEMLALVSTEGGVGITQPGETAQATLQLDEGQYVALCFVESPDGVPHLAKGMVQPFQVVANPDQDAGEEPVADQTIGLADFKFHFPETITSGPQVWKITNEGPQPHEMGLFKLAPGKTMADFEAFMMNPSGEPPFEEIPGMQAIMAGDSGWLTLDLEAGEYIALCFVPDPATGKSHLELGMISQFTVE